MASSETPRLGLSVWDSGDTLTMSEFNQNHQRLEERLGRMAEFTIFETTLSQSAATISLNIDTSSWGEYDYVFVDWELNLSRNDAYARMRLNNSTSEDQSYCYFQGDFYEPHGDRKYVALTTGNGACARTRFNVRKDREHSIVCETESDTSFSWGTFSGVTYSQINQINFVCTSSGATILSGGHVRIWGVK